MATTSLTATIRLADNWDHQAVDDVGSAKDSNPEPLEVRFTYGTGDDQVNDQYRARLTLKSNTEVAIDLAGGVTNVFGTVLTFSSIKEIRITNLATDATHVLKVGQLGTPTSGNLMSDIFDGSTTSRIKLRAGATFLLLAPLTGYTVTGGSADVLLISNEGPGFSVDFDIVIKGVLA